MKKLLALLLALLLLAPAALAAPSPEPPAPAPTHQPPEPTPVPPELLNLIKNPKEKNNFRFRVDKKILHIWFPNIMNADEAIFVFGDEVWLLDCGDRRYGAMGVELLKQLGITTVDKLINSHPHHDHLEGIKVTTEAVTVKELLICFPDKATDTMITALDHAKWAKIPVTRFDNGDVFEMGDGQVTFTNYVIKSSSVDINNNSAQTMVQYGARRILFTGDMEREGQAILLTQVPAEDLKADILKYPHHGKTGLLEEFREAVSPSLAIVTNGNVDWAGVEYLKVKRIPYYFTANGKSYIHLMTDGYTWVVEHVPIANFPEEYQKSTPSPSPTPAKTGK